METGPGSLMDSVGPGGRPSITIAPLEEEDYSRGVPVMSYLSWRLGENLSEEDKQVKEWLAAYQANCRLVLDEQGAAFIDSNGLRRPIPPETNQVFLRTWRWVSATGTSPTTCLAWLVLCDRDGKPLLGLPPYGWSREDLERFASAAGWDLDLANTTLDDYQWDRTFPGWMKAPHAFVGGRWRHDRSLSRRLRGLFSHRSGGSR